MAIKIDRKLNGQDIVEKEFGDFIENGGEIGGSGDHNHTKLSINGRSIEAIGDALALRGQNTRSIFLYRDEGYKFDTLMPSQEQQGDYPINLGQEFSPWNEIYLKGVSKGANGYTKLPNGMIMQWGTYIPIVNHDAQYINYPLTFPNGCLSTTVTHVSEDSNTNAVETNYSIRPGGNNQFRFRLASTDTGRLSNFKIQWMAIGY